MTYPHGRGRDVEHLIERALAIDDPAVWGTVHGLVMVLMEMHQRGLTRILALTEADGPHGSTLVRRLAADADIGPLLVLHDLHPVSLVTRVNQALAEARPYLRSHGGDVEVLSVEPTGRVHLRLNGQAPAGRPSDVLLRSTVERAIYDAAPDVTDLVVDEGAPDVLPIEGFVPLAELRLSPDEPPAGMR
jgi:Fe-S cluster biogenesis protein NfuA